MNTTAGRSIVLVLVALVAWSGLAPVRAMAEAPKYEPYGAWRGRIRYVEGPRRVRTHVRWGNGITPVGGQVLMHLATVAGNVATNENFLNAVNPIKREADPQLVSAVNQLGEKNQQLVKALNDVRKRPDIMLPELVLKVDVAAVAPPPNGGQPGIDVNSLLMQRELKGETITKNRPILVSIIHHTAATTDSVIGASEEQKTKRAALITFLAKDFCQGISPPQAIVPPETAADFMASVTDINERKTAMMDVLKEAIDVNGRLLRADPTAHPDRVKELTGEVEQYGKFMADLEGLNL